MVDSLSPRQFIELFDRLSKIIDFRGCKNPQDVKHKVKRHLDMQKRSFRTAKKGSTAKRYRGNYNHFRTLYRHGLHKRIWNEAVENPGGIIDLTLDYGYEKAKQIKLERSRRKLKKVR